ncbi:fam11a b protein [Anaeramoeba ignava]|uniref:Fam11a b protein n=1 Tax=Anaeramoeba ignava TaxID=1746090 RepID=A0A9Q0R799_ANAIG|nr:fam11a b protein [Anaeramoeba ignava]
MLIIWIEIEKKNGVFLFEIFFIFFLCENKMRKSIKRNLKSTENIETRFHLKIYKSKGVIIIPKNAIELIKNGKYLESNKNNQISPTEPNLIIEKLPLEILFMICEYLSPGDFIKFGMTCSSFQDICNDQETWRRIAKSYQKFFIYDYIQRDSYTNEIVGFQSWNNPKFETFSLKNGNEKNREKMKAKRKKEQSKYFNNFIVDESTKQNSSGRNRPIIQSSKQERIEYIDSLENPKEEMIEKGKEIYEIFLEEKLEQEKSKRNQKFDLKRSIFEDKSEAFLTPILLILLSFGSTVFLVMIHLKIEKKIDYKLIYLMHLEIFEINDISDFFEFPSRILTLFSILQVIFIALRVDDYIHWNWIVVFIPLLVFLVFMGIFLLITIQNMEFGNLGIFPIFLLFFFFLFFLFLGLRMDETIKWKYGIVFIPLYLEFFLECCGSAILQNLTGVIDLFLLRLIVIIYFCVHLICLITIPIYFENSQQISLYFFFSFLYLLFLILDFGSIFFFKKRME